MNKRRLVVLDGHIIAQFHNGLAWWTCTKAAHGNEEDFAVWLESRATMAKARKLVGDVQVIRSDKKPYEQGGGWYADPAHEQKRPKTYREALRELARGIE